MLVETHDQSGNVDQPMSHQAIREARVMGLKALANSGVPYVKPGEAQYIQSAVSNGVSPEAAAEHVTDQHDVVHTPVDIQVQAAQAQEQIPVAHGSRLN